MCTYNDGNTIFLLSTKKYGSGEYYYNDALKLKPNATFALNGKSYTTQAYVPNIDDLTNYSTSSSRVRHKDYMTTSRCGDQYYVVKNATSSIGGGISASGQIHSAYSVYLVIKITS